MKVSPPAPAEWAVLVYSSASPDIEAPALASLEEVARARQPDSVILGAQIGLSSGTARYRFTGERDDEMAAPPTQVLPPTDMSVPTSLEDFLRWGMRAFPARRYVVVVGGHGGGFLGAVTDPARRRMMRPDELAGALARSGLRPDVLVLNACFGAQAEVAREVAPFAGYLVASQGLEHGVGMPLGRVVEDLAGARSAEAAARLIVQDCAAVPDQVPAVSALDLSRVEALATVLDGLGRSILAHPETVPELRAIIRSLQHFRTDRPGDRPLTDLRDLGTFVRRVHEHESLAGTDLPAAARAVEAALGGVCVEHASRPDHEGATGVSLYLPTAPLSDALGPIADDVEAIYRRLALSRTTSWDEAVALLSLRDPGQAT